jgi:ATP-binding cassette subfamily A (ABC1) protein 3
LIPVGPPNRLTVASLPGEYRQYSNRLRVQNSYADYEDYIHKHFRDVAPGGLWLGNTSNPTPLVSYRINGNPGYAGLAKYLSDSYLTGRSINAHFSTFALPFNTSTGDSLQLVLYITLGLCVFPAFLALYPCYERLSNVRALHYSSSVRPAPLWLAYLLFDGITVALVSVVVVVLVTTLSDGWYAPGYLFFAIFLYVTTSRC